MDHSVVFKNVTKKYKMYSKNSDKLLDILLPDRYGEDFYALQNISFTANRGDVIGIIGVNGAGKSTLSNLITGVIPPTSGEISIEGQASLISISSGLNNSLTGRENIELKCLMLGFNKNEIQNMMPDIIEFADIGNFIDQPVKNYSSGMKARLGFAISVNIDPDVLVVDEALSVGDQTFTDKCYEKMNEFRDKGKTIFFISHAIPQIRRFCQKALWLEAGEVRAYGTIQEIIPQYQKFLKEFKAMSKEDRANFKQLVLEKRSKLRAAEPQEPSDINEGQPNEQEHTNEPVMQRGKSVTSVTELTRKKAKQKKKKLGNYLLLLVLVLASTLLIWKWNDVITYFQADSKESVAKVADTKSTKQKAKKPAQKAKETATHVQKDIRYVQMKTGFVRDQPNLQTSQRITMVNFGDAITVEEIAEDPAEGFNWLKFTLPSGQTGWISEKLVSKLDAPTGKKSLDASVKALVQQESFNVMVGYLGKTAQTISENGTQKSAEMAFDAAGKVYEVSSSITRITKEQLKEKLGEPVLQAEENTYLYHGIKHDYVFVSDNGYSFGTMKVRAAAK